MAKFKKVKPASKVVVDSRPAEKKTGPRLSRFSRKSKILIIIALVIIVVSSSIYFVHNKSGNNNIIKSPYVPFGQNSNVLNDSQKLNQLISGQEGLDISKLTNTQKYTHYVYLADLEQSAKEYDKAIKNYKNAQTINEQSAGIDVGIGDCYVALGDNNLAKISYQLALNIYQQQVPKDTQLQNLIKNLQTKISKL